MNFGGTVFLPVKMAFDSCVYPGDYCPIQEPGYFHHCEFAHVPFCPDSVAADYSCIQINGIM